MLSTHFCLYEAALTQFSAFDLLVSCIFDARVVVHSGELPIRGTFCIDFVIHLFRNLSHLSFAHNCYNYFSITKTLLLCVFYAHPDHTAV